MISTKKKNTHIFAYYTLDAQQETPCPTYSIKYFDKNGNKNTIIDKSIGSILQVWPNNLSSGLPPHVKYIIGKKYDTKVKAGKLAEFGSKTGRPSPDVVVSALQLILDSISDSANKYKVVKLTSLESLYKTTNVDNCIKEAFINIIIKDINAYVTSLNTIPSGTCNTLNTDTKFIAYRILSNALDNNNNPSILPIPIYFYMNDGDDNQDTKNNLKLVKLISKNIDIKPTPKLPVTYNLDTPILYSEFDNPSPHEFILILKKT